MDTSLDPQHGGTPMQLQPRKRRWIKPLLWAVVMLMSASVLQVTVLNVINPLASSFMVWRVAGQWASGNTGYRVSYQWRDLKIMSPAVPRALVAAEDQRFAEHAGFDFEAIEAAERYNQRQATRAARTGKAAKVRGASTISQQVAKNLFLWQGQGATRWLRKGLEVWYTFWLERLVPKRRILELYANVAEFGDGVYGVQAAARHIFNTDASRLTAAQAARLAAVLPAPRKWDAGRPSAYVARRAAAIQRQMRLMGGTGVD